MLTSRVDVDYGQELRQLAGTPWSTRMAAGPAGRPALEVYRGAALIDVMVARSFAPRPLRGAHRVARHGLMYCVAWGCLPADGSGIRVEFRTSRLRALLRNPGNQRARTVAPLEIAGLFWIATATGHFDRVAITGLDCQDRCVVRTLR